MLVVNIFCIFSVLIGRYSHVNNFRLHGVFLNFALNTTLCSSKLRKNVCLRPPNLYIRPLKRYYHFGGSFKKQFYHEKAFRRAYVQVGGTCSMYMYRKNKILLYIGSSTIPLANARGSENFGSF